MIGSAADQGKLPDAVYRCAEMKPIKRIGGCDAFGNCGVRYGDDSTGFENKPVHGHYVCTKREWFPNKK